MEKIILKDGEIETTFDNDAYRLETMRDNQGKVTSNFNVKTRNTQAILYQLMQDLTYANGQIDMILFNLKVWADKNLIPMEAYNEIVRVVKASVNDAIFHRK